MTSTTPEPPVRYVGCCGAYCRTCRALADGVCKGCRLGYATRDRDITKARCAMKVCCVTRGLGACADCPDLASCEIIQSFFSKNGHKYGRYRASTEFIRDHGYEAFLRQADTWKGAYGRLEPPV